MTDYKEEQQNEVEALESIYPDELTLITDEPFYCFQMTVTTQSDNSDAEEASCVLEFTYTAKYPDELPVMEIKSYENLEQEHVDSLLELMKEQGEENLGMGMVFTIVSAVQEKLLDLVEELATQKQEEEEERIRQKEEADRKKFEGTLVTVESFLAWKAKFDAELTEIKRQKGIVAKGPQKLTGKELFMMDHTLDDSDVKFLEEEGGETVTVDESLFQDMDDLDLDDLEDDS